ncbi:MAG: Stp1/IreP family PP2C-type Ser/Thr phosphatase [Armatimonadetes bacterium]|nr:Stp1/IreP family PP2C-type Ser/Thr phosphatase [Armatimonadota bacterium]
MPLAAAAKTDPGRVRGENQDAFAVYLDRAFFIVADGMGGMNAGKLAAEMSVERVSEAFLSVDANNSPERLKDVVRDVSREIWQKAGSCKSMCGMGATLVAVYVEGASAHVLHAGDSRVYLHREGKLSLLTEDHSVVQGLIRQGYINEKQARVHPCRNQLTRHMGLEKLDPALQKLSLQKGDRLLLCTDGLTKELTEDRIVSILSSEPDLDKCSHRLVEEAVAAGGRDNVTVLLIESH